MSSAKPRLLGEIAEEVNERVGPGAETPVYAVTKHAGFVPSAEYFKKRVHSADIAKYKRVKYGQFAYATIHLDEGSIGLLEHTQEVAISPMYTVFKVDESEVWQPFLFRLLKSPRMLSQYPALGSGTVHRRKSVPFRRLADLSLALPDIDEQKRIAAILDYADAIRRKRQQAITLTEDLLRSAFLEIFGNPLLNPKGWPEVPLESLIATVDAGWSARGDARNRAGDEWGVLKVSAVTSGYFKPREHKAVAKEQVRGRKLIVPKRGDLLFSRANTRELVAAVCLVEADCEREFLPDKLWRISTHPADATREYLRFLIGDPGFRSRLTRTATGTSASMLNISQEKLLGCIAPKPPIELQEQFSEIVWKTIGLRSVARRVEKGTDDLFHSLSQRAFRGEV